MRRYRTTSPIPIACPSIGFPPHHLAPALDALSLPLFSHQATVNLTHPTHKPIHANVPFLPHRPTYLRTLFHHAKPRIMAIQPDADVYRPFLLSPIPGAEHDISGQPAIGPDWTTDIELDTTKDLVRSLGEGKRLKVLVLYGSLRER